MKAVKVPNRPKQGRNRSTTFYSATKVASVVKPTMKRVVPIVKQLQYDPDLGIPHLERWMSSLEAGSRIDVRTNIYSHLSREEVKHGLTAQVKRHAAEIKSLDSIAPEYDRVWNEVEESQAKNWGPQSIYLPWTLDGPEKVRAVFSDKPLPDAVKAHALDQALDWLSNLLPPSSIKRVPIIETVSSINGVSTNRLDLTTNAGCPSWKSNWWTQNGPMTAEQREWQEWLWNKVNSDLKALVGASSYQDFPLEYWATSGQRLVQKGPEPLKPNESGKMKAKRIVCAMPKYETILGKSIFVKLQRALMEVKCPKTGTRIFAGWFANSKIDKNMQMMLQSAEDNGQTVVSGDISSFDASVPPELMWRVAQAMSKWMEPVTARIFLAIMDANVHRTGIITPSEIIPPTTGSVKSGSIFTNLIDSCVNLVINMYGQFAGYYQLDAIAVNGDDMVGCGPSYTPETCEHSFSDFNMEMNASKAFYERRMLHFLQRLHVLGIPGGQGSIYRIGGNCLSMEDDTTMKWNERSDWSMTVQALYRLENGAFNPLFETLVSYIKRGSPIQLGEAYSPAYVNRMAGNYAVRKMEEAKVKPWTPVGSGVGFNDFAVNRVIRGGKLPEPGYERFKSVYGISYESVAA